MTSSDPAPPKTLKADGKRLWRAVVGTFALEAYQLEVLRVGCEALDRAEQARAEVEQKGLTVPTKTGVKTNPAIAIEQNGRLAALRAVRELNLAPPPADSRPPHLGYGG
jgi:phage terminase small subunit